MTLLQALWAQRRKLLIALEASALSVIGCAALCAQGTVTISSQPGQVFIANFGAPVVAVSLYSAMICSGAGTTASGSWGEIRQIAEGAGINIVDNALVPATAQRAQNKTTLHKIVEGLGYAGLATAAIAAFHTSPAWLIDLGTGLSGGAAVVDQPLSASEQQAQQTIMTALSALADPSAQFNVSNGACVSSRLMFGQSVKNFVPIKATLPGPVAASVPDRRSMPRSAVPSSSEVPPVIETVEQEAVPIYYAKWMLGR